MEEIWTWRTWIRNLRVFRSPLHFTHLVTYVHSPGRQRNLTNNVIEGFDRLESSQKTGNDILSCHCEDGWSVARRVYFTTYTVRKSFRHLRHIYTLWSVFHYHLGTRNIPFHFTTPMFSSTPHPPYTTRLKHEIRGSNKIKTDRDVGSWEVLHLIGQPDRYLPWQDEQNYRGTLVRA